MTKIVDDTVKASESILVSLIAQIQIIVPCINSHVKEKKNHECYILLVPAAAGGGEYCTHRNEDARISNIPTGQTFCHSQSMRPTPGIVVFTGQRGETPTFDAYSGEIFK